MGRIELRLEESVYWEDRFKEGKREDLPIWDDGNQPKGEDEVRPRGTLITDFDHDLEVDRHDALLPSREDWERESYRELARPLLGPAYEVDDHEGVYLPAGRPAASVGISQENPVDLPV